MPQTTDIEIYDFDLCKGREQLKQLIHFINKKGWEIISLSQNGDTYTVLFRRPA